MKSLGDQRLWEQAKDLAPLLAARMAPPGALGLPALLEERRLKYGIPDGAFKQQALYDRLLVCQIPEWEGDTYGDTQILMPESGKKRMEESAPRGVIVSAGLLALDHLRSHGSDIGHIVKFVRLAPWRLICDMIGGHEFPLLVLRSGDLIADEDLAARLRAGSTKVAADAEHGHHLVDGDGVRMSPGKPYIPEDY